MNQTYWQQKQGIIGNFTTLKSFQEQGPDYQVRIAAEQFIKENNINNLIELGCNTGIMPFRLRDQNWKGLYTGIDNNQKALDLAKNLLEKYRNIYFINNSVENVKIIQDNSFELVYSKDVIEHLPYYENTLKEAFRISQKFILLSTFIHHQKNDKIYRHPEGYYLNSYGEPRLIQFCKDHGYSVKSIYKDEVYGLLLMKKIK